MQTKLFLAAAVTVFATFAQAQLDDDDIPSQCNAVCSPVTSLVNSCQSQNGGNDDDDNSSDPNSDDDNNDGSALLSCVCNASNAATQIPACAQCLAQNNNDDDDDQQDINSFSRACNFAAATGSSTSGLTSSTSVASTTATPTPSTSTTTSLATDSNGSTTATITSTAVVTPSAQSTSSTTSPNGAAMTAAPIFGAGVMAMVLAAL